MPPLFADDMLGSSPLTDPMVPWQPHTTARPANNAQSWCDLFVELCIDTPLARDVDRRLISERLIRACSAALRGP
jgi:hypothetical protein